LLALAVAGAGIVCLADYMTSAPRSRCELVEVLAAETVDVYQPVHAVYYRNTTLSSRITRFLDYVSTHLKSSDQIGQRDSAGRGPFSLPAPGAAAELPPSTP
jgi:DNA-binding transcriptional LysR family regulator